MRFPVSKFQKELEKEILDSVEGEARRVLELLLDDKELNHIQEYANIVSINRLGYNDHGPVHARMVAKNSMKILDLIKGKIPTSLEHEKLGTFEDSKICLLISAFCHDLGMSLGRTYHERNSIIMGGPIIDRILELLYKDNSLKYIMKAIILECILGHMGNYEVTSIEAGILLVSDGCDMTKGRARIPYALKNKPAVGDIHKYSAMSINHVIIEPGPKDKPVRITIEMEETAGIFQVEEILLGKVSMSSIRENIQILAKLKGGKELFYL